MTTAETNGGGYTAVPNWLIDQAATLSSTAFTVAVVICRLTVGWNKDTDAISLSRLHQLTSLSKPTLISAMRDLGKAGIVEHTGTGHRGMGVYRLVKEFDRSSFFTGQVSLPVNDGSEPEPVKFFDQSGPRPVKKFDTQKKDSNTTTSVVVAAAMSEEPEPNYAEDGQLTLVGCSEPPPPSAAAPPAPTKPKRARAHVAEEARALYAPLFVLTKSPRKGDAAMGVYTKARDLWLEFQATPEQVAAFWEWFKTFSQAAQIAARERRPLNPPKPRQVYEAWPQFLEWWQARQLDLARRAEAERRRREAPPEEAPARRGLGYNPFRNKLTQPAPVLTAATTVTD
jgi:phage replication O-like protein O